LKKGVTSYVVFAYWLARLGPNPTTLNMVFSVANSNCPAQN
jgi:hypothetical protein